MQGASGNSGGYNGGPVAQDTNNTTDIFGGPAMFGMDSSGWTVATGGGNATGAGGIPWVPIAIAGAVLVGFIAWNSRRK